MQFGDCWRIDCRIDVELAHSLALSLLFFQVFRMFNGEEGYQQLQGYTPQRYYLDFFEGTYWQIVRLCLNCWTSTIKRLKVDKVYRNLVSV